MAWTTPACIIWGFLYVSVGSGAAETYRELQDTVSWAGWIFVGIFVLAMGLIALMKHVLHRYSHIDDDAAEDPARK
jgi:membrane protein DedA with SNARE-associated domain